MYQLLSGHYISITLNNDLIASELPKRVNIIPKSTTEYLGNIEGYSSYPSVNVGVNPLN